MIVIWAVLIAVGLLFEFFTVDFFACCFAIGAIIPLILAACNVSLYVQLPVFVGVTILAILLARPLLKKWLIKKTVPTNLDQNFGQTAKLLTDVVDGQATIKINDVVWTVLCDTALTKGATVTIESAKGNKLIVKGAE